MVDVYGVILAGITPNDHRLEGAPHDMLKYRTSLGFSHAMVPFGVPLFCVAPIWDLVICSTS